MRAKNITDSIILIAVGAILLLRGCSFDQLSDQSTGPEYALQRGLSVYKATGGGRLHPLRIALVHQRFLYVTDSFSGKILKFLAVHGQVSLKREFTIDGQPSGIAWGANFLFIGNETRGTVGVYRTNGMWLYDLGGSGAFSSPSDIAVDERTGLVFVLDSYERIVKVFNLDGNPQAIFTGDTYGFQNPTGIAVDMRRREVLVSDYGDFSGYGAPSQIKIFDYQGRSLKAISGKMGMLGQRFSRPQGLVVDAEGHILVVDAFAGELLVLDRETGDTLEIIGRRGTDPGELMLPLDIVIDRDQFAYVTNNRLGRIEAYPLGGLR